MKWIIARVARSVNWMMRKLAIARRCRMEGLVLLAIEDVIEVVGFGMKGEVRVLIVVRVCVRRVGSMSGAEKKSMKGGR